MEDKILIDTNVLLDYLLIREPFCHDAKMIMQACTDNKIRGSIAAHSIPNLFYILRKDYEPEERRELLINICKIFDVVGINNDKIVSALKNKEFTDYEDCLQMECAKEYAAKYIITRNVPDFTASEIKAITPEEYVKLLHK